MSSLNVEKDFLSNVDYLKSLVKEVKSKTLSDYDSNLIYEVTYADMYVTDLLTKVKDPKLAENINDIKIALDLIIEDIPDDDVEKARSEVDYTKILKAKYDNVDDGSFEEEVAYSNIDESNVVKEYLKKRSFSIITLTIFLLIMLVGVDNIVNKIISVLNNITGNSEALSNNANEIMTTLIGVTSTIFGLVVVMMVAVLGIGIAVDMMYLVIPAFRMIIGDRGDTKLVSIYAKAAVEEVDGHLISFKKIKSYDRIKRNKYWLNSMLDSLAMLKRSGKEIDIDFANALVDLNSDINNCKERSKEWYRYIAKIEFMHDKYIKVMDKVVS